MEELKDLVEKIIEYTRKWSISDTEWYYNVDCSRKNAYGEKYITSEEFEAAIREEILYDLVYKNGVNTLNQLENDLCNYDYDLIGKDSEALEKEIQKVIKDFKIERSYYK